MTKAKLGSIGLSFLVLALLVVWMATGDVKEARDEAPEDTPEESVSAPSVQVDVLRTRLYEPGLMLLPILPSQFEVIDKAPQYQMA